MPTYDYLCSKCGHKFEKFQSITAGTLKKCPECGKMSLQRLIGTGSGIIFKGSGFYETDYRKKDGGGSAASSTPKKDAETKSTEKKETKTADSKPAEKKTETKSADKK